MTKETKVTDLRGKTDDELQAFVMQQRKAQMDLRFAAAQGKVADTSAMRAARRDIARAKTLQAEAAYGLNQNVAAKAPKAAKPKAPKASNKPVVQAKTTTRTKKKEG